MNLEEELQSNNCFTLEGLKTLKGKLEHLEVKLQDNYSFPDEELKEIFPILTLSYYKSKGNVRSAYYDPYYDNEDEELQKDLESTFRRLWKMHPFDIEDLMQARN